MTGFICHDSYYERLKRLSNEEVGNLFRQLMLYHAKRFDEMSEFVGSEGIAFDFIASDIDHMEEKYNSTSETNRLNGLKGGRPKKNQNPNGSEENRQKPTETEENRQEPTESDEKPTKGYKDKDKGKDKDKNIEKEKEKEKNNELFDRFWQTYPRHENKQAAIKAFNKLGITEEMLMMLLSSIERQKESAQWKENGGQFIPHPATWLNGHRWEDELSQVVAAKNVNAQNYSQRDYSNESDDVFKRMIEQMEGHGA